jgi:apolipoprotein N-acyltransferase
MQPSTQPEPVNLRRWPLWVAAVLSAGLLELPFPIAGPMPPWRSIFAWFGLVPLLWAVLSPPCVRGPRPLRAAFLAAYGCGVLWYAGNCYWIYDTMMHYGSLPPWVSVLLLLGFSLVLGLYFGLFGLGVAFVQKTTGSTRLALAFAPVLWTALELAAARITSVPWDQLGYSQVDNGFISRLAPWTGVYGISFVLVAANSLLASGFLTPRALTGRFTKGFGWSFASACLALACFSGIYLPPVKAPTSATAVLIQPNLDVSHTGYWLGPGEWASHMAQFIQLAELSCKSYIAGIPQTGAPSVSPSCPPQPARPDLVAWPESPAPFFESDPRFRQSMSGIAQVVQAPLIVNGIGSQFSAAEGGWHDYVSAMIFTAAGREIGRYDKMHLVPFGEYIPFARLLFFAHKLTGKVASFTPGSTRKVFHIEGPDGRMQRYGVFICYEAVFADEVRQFAKLGAEVLVNLSDDGWYGDTSAPWQHLNMARMRAVENRRWLLRDTNNGVTAVIDPYGRVVQSIPRHQVDALPAAFGFRDDITFYTAHGDVFAWLCVILTIGVIAWSVNRQQASR